MKKLIAILLIGVSSAASAQHYGHHYHGYNGGGGNWVAPLVIGGALGYMISRPPVVVQQPPVVVAPSPVVVQSPVPIYQEVLQYNTECQCYVKTYQQIGWK
jgi:hypothetical protein